MYKAPIPFEPPLIKPVKPAGSPSSNPQDWGDYHRDLLRYEAEKERRDHMRQLQLAEDEKEAIDLQSFISALIATVCLVFASVFVRFDGIKALISLISHGVLIMAIFVLFFYLFKTLIYSRKDDENE